MAPSVVPEPLEGWMRPFRCHFTAAAWRHVLVLVGGALLAPGRRTVAAALRVMGLGEVAGFAVFQSWNPWQTVEWPPFRHHSGGFQLRPSRLNKLR